MTTIRFKQHKTPSRFVRLDRELDAELTAIAESEDTTLSDVLRTFIRIGLEQYKRQEGRDGRN